MTDAEDSSDAARAAMDALASGPATLAGVEAAHPEARAIRSPDGELDGWFVGLVVRDSLIGFVQLDRSLEHPRVGSFGGSAQRAADWLDPDRVLTVAQSLLEPEERPGRPFLSYDVSPDRIGWIVPVGVPGGRSRRLMVTGQTAFELPEEEPIRQP